MNPALPPCRDATSLFVVPWEQQLVLLFLLPWLMRLMLPLPGPENPDHIFFKLLREKKVKFTLQSNSVHTLSTREKL